MIHCNPVRLNVVEFKFIYVCSFAYIHISNSVTQQRVEIMAIYSIRCRGLKVTKFENANTQHHRHSLIKSSCIQSKLNLILYVAARICVLFLFFFAQCACCCFKSRIFPSFLICFHKFSLHCT